MLARYRAHDHLVGDDAYAAIFTVTFVRYVEAECRISFDDVEFAGMAQSGGDHDGRGLALRRPGDVVSLHGMRVLRCLSVREGQWQCVMQVEQVTDLPIGEEQVSLHGYGITVGVLVLHL